MSKDDLIDMQGTVVAVHSGGLYRVQCDAGHEVLAQLSGRMRRFRIKVVPGDRVTVGVSPYAKFFSIAMTPRFVVVTLIAHVVFGIGLGAYFAWNARRWPLRVAPATA